MPTSAQARFLEFLCAFPGLTTRQINDSLGTGKTRRATQRMLARLVEHALVETKMVQPELGARSERCWFPTQGGRAVVQQPQNETHLAQLIGQGAIVSYHELTREQAAIMHLLAKMKHLSRKQIRGHLYPSKSEWYTWRRLNSLRKRGYVHAEPLCPERGAASEYYWVLTRRGASKLGVKFTGTYRRRPTQYTIKHRGLLLEMARQVAEAGWELIMPVAAQPGPESPQREQLVKAVLRREGMAIENLLLQGYPANRLTERIERWNAGQVGAVVPRKVNEYVAHVPGHPEQTVLLIPHPLIAGRGFWTRSPSLGPRRRGRYPKIGSRLNRYSRLAQILPVLAVFTSEETGRQYGDLLASQGMRWTLANKIGENLWANGWRAEIDIQPSSREETVRVR